MSRSVQKVIGKGLTKRMECGVGMGKRKPQSQLSSLEDQAESPKFWPDDMGGIRAFRQGVAQASVCFWKSFPCGQNQAECQVDWQR